MLHLAPNPNSQSSDVLNLRSTSWFCLLIMGDFHVEQMSNKPGHLFDIAV